MSSGARDGWGIGAGTFPPLCVASPRAQGICHGWKGWGCPPVWWHGLGTSHIAVATSILPSVQPYKQQVSVHHASPCFLHAPLRNK